jgi:cytosine/uracil/thiamine/allantoin permease
MPYNVSHNANVASNKSAKCIGWNGGRLLAVCLTAIWPSYARLKNTFGADMPTTTDQFVGFVIFWFLSTPFLWLRPERFKIPFVIVCAWCGLGMICWMIWALSVAKGVGPLWYTGQSVPAGAQFGTSWLIMAGISEFNAQIALETCTHFAYQTRVSVAWLRALRTARISPDIPKDAGTMLLVRSVVASLPASLCRLWVW